MELKIGEFQAPKQITFNYQDLKAQLEQKCSDYKGIVVTEDQIAPAKADLASLRKMDKALNDERIRLQKEYMEPFNIFKAQIDELRTIVIEAEDAIDVQLKAFDEKQKAEKMEQIKGAFEAAGFANFVTLEMIFNKSWLNKSCSIKKVQDDLTEIQHRIGEEVLTINQLPEFSFEALECYKQTLSLPDAIARGRHLADIQRRKEEAKKQAEEDALAKAAEQEQEEEKPQEQPENQPEVQRWPVTFQTLVSEDEARTIVTFLKEHGIKYQLIQ